MKNSTEKQETPKLRTSWVPIPVAVVIAMLGVCFIAFSSIIEYLAYAIGIFVIIGAAALGTATIMGKKHDFLFFLKIVFSVCCIATGILAILFNEYAAGVICIVFSSAVAIDGSVKLGTAIRSNRYSVPGKTVAAVIAILTVAVALAMVRFTPYDISDTNIKKCSVIIGISFILDAIGNFIIPFLNMGINRRIVKKIVDGIPEAPDGALTASEEEPRAELPDEQADGLTASEPTTEPSPAAEEGTPTDEEALTDSESAEEHAEPDKGIACEADDSDKECTEPAEGTTCDADESQERDNEVNSDEISETAAPVQNFGTSAEEESTDGQPL